MSSELWPKGSTARFPFLRVLGFFLLVLLGYHSAVSAFGITRRSTDTDFLISTQFSSNNIGGMYVAYEIDNDTGISYDDVWVQIDSFTGGVVGLAPNEDGRQQLGAMTPGQKTMAYIYLGATTDTTVDQGHTVRIYDGRPDLAGSTELDSAAFIFTGVDTSIAASANKVDIVVSGPDPATVGGIVTVQVEGRTGNVGAGSNIELTPAGDLDWPADTFQLVATDITFFNIQGSNCGSNVLGSFSDQLQSIWSDTACYVALYRFQATNTTNQPTSVSPIIHVASGTQIKHTDTGGFASLPPISPPQNSLTLVKSVAPAALSNGGTVGYTLTLSNSASNASCPAAEPTCNDLVVQEFEDTLPVSPASVTYETGTSLFGGSTVDDPIQSGNVLNWFGTFTVPAGGTASLTYDITIPAVDGSYVNSAIARIGSFQIDTTTDATNVPATTTVTVGTESPSIGIAKDASVTGTGPFDVTLDFYLENFGNVDLDEVQVTDDLDTAFGVGNYAITSGPTIIADPGGGLTASTIFDGIGNQDLLAAGSTLAVSQTAQLRLVVSVTNPGSYTNSATAGGDPPSGPGNRVTDDSVSGTDPDDNGNDDPSDDVGDTPIDLAETPSIGIAKDASFTGTGPFDVTLDFYLENFGNVSLSEVQVTDDLDTAFGVGNYAITSGPTIIADPGGELTASTIFDGSGNQDLLAAASTLAVSQTAQLRLVVSVTNPGSYTNSATAGGDPPSGPGNRVTDDSVSGTDPDDNGNDDPSDDVGDTPIDLAETPSIGIAKDASFTGTGPFDVTLDFYLENFGNVDLDEVQVTDDLDTAFGVGNYSITSGPTIIADPGGGLTASTIFDGSGNQDLLAAASTLAVSQTAQLRLVVSVTNPGSYTNSATAGGDPPSGPGNRVTDDSVSGTDPDDNGNDDPSDDVGDTPIVLAEIASIGIAKDASFTGTGPFDVTLDFYLENFGNVDLDEVQVTDDLDTAFGVGNYAITSGPTILADPGGGLTASTIFDGSGNQDLLAAGSTLAVSQTAQLRLVVSVTNPGSYTNSATAGGDPPSGPGNRVTDDSVSGTDPDDNGNDDPSDDVGDTPIVLAEIASIGIAKDASFTGSGPFDVTLDFYLENFGNVDLDEVQVTDDLDTAFGAGNYSITSGPTIIADPGGGLTASTIFDGSGNQDLLAAGSMLAVSQTAQLRLVVSVTNPGSYTNSATAGGDPPSGSGNRVTDDSVSGTDPDDNGNDDPSDDVGDTPIDLAETPSIGIAKDASVTGTGPFDVTLDFYLENFGNVDLDEVQVTDDLDTAFGAGNYAITSGPTIIADPGGGLTASTIFDGSGNQELLAAGSALDVGDIAQLRVVVSVTNPGSYTNSATAGGDPPSGPGNRVTDDSVSGTDPDDNGNDDPSDDVGDTPIVLAEIASIGIAKDASFTGTGPFDVTLDFYLENFGNVDLDEVQVADDLDAAFGAGNYSITSGPTIIADPGGGLTASTIFDGSGNLNLLAAGSTLAVSQMAQLRMVVSVTNPGSYTNSATAGGDPPSGPGNRVTDDSVSGTDPDDNGNDDPSDDVGDTPIVLAETPSIGIAKDASVTGSGPFDVTLDFYLENFGNVDLDEVQVTDDLDTAFGAGNYSITSGPTIIADPGGGLTASTIFDGSGNQELLAAGSALDVGDIAQLRVVVSVTNPGSYTNSATAGGDPPSGPGNRVTDDSVSGTDPDDNGNDDPSDDVGDTPIVLAEIASIGIAKDASFTGTGPFDVTLDFYLENFGNVDLDEVQVADDLDAAFGAGNYSITSGPTIIADPGGGLTASTIFDGSGNLNLLAAGSTLAVSQMAQLRMVVSVTNPGSYTNSATAGGDPPSGPGNRVTDDSVSGTDPDDNGNDDPSDDVGDTPIVLAETPSIGIAKDASVTGSGPFDVTLDFYLENFGNVDLDEVQVTDDLDTAFGAGNYSITSGPTIIADPGGGLTASTIFDGSGNQDLLAAASTLAVSQTAQLRMVVSVTSPGSYTNSATAGGDPPSGPGNRVTDDSVSGTDPDDNGNDDPSDDVGGTPIDLAETPSIGIAKDASFTGTGPFDVTLDFYLENFGNVSLSEVQVTDDLDTAFGVGNYAITSGPTILADPGGGLTASTIFDGSGNQDLLAAGSTLAVSQTAQLRLVVSVTSPGSYTNSATAGGDPPSGPGNRVTDDSVSGTDPDDNGNDDPSDDVGDTPIVLAETPSIGIAKDASVTGSGPFDVTLDFYLENFGNVDLDEVQVADDLDAAFGAGNYSITSGPTIIADPGGGLTASTIFDGSGNLNLLAAGSTLAVSQTAQLRMVVSVTNPGSYTNSATAGGDPPSGPGNRVTDDSVSGTDPDDNGNDDPSDDVGDTPIVLAETPSIGIAKDASVTGSGPFDVTLDFYLENFGNVDLDEVQVADDLDAAFGAGNYSITSGPTIIADPGGGLTASTIFDGSGNLNLLAAGSTLAVSQMARLRMVVSVTNPGSYTNSATAGGDPPSGPGNRVTDDSVSGTDPDDNGNDDPSDDVGDTPIDLAETPSIGIAKDASFTGSGPFDVTLDFYLENFGNVDLDEVQVTDDLNTAFGAGNYSITSGPTIIADPGGGLTASTIFDGSGNQDLLATGSTLAVSQTAQLRLVVSVTNPGSYTNRATAGGDPPSGPGNRVTDDSVSGTDPDDNGNDDPSDDVGDTPIVLAEIASIGIAKDASVTGSGPFEVTLDFHLENFGSVSLSEVQVTDDLDAAFGAGNYSITSGPTIIADPGGGLTASTIFDGSGDQNLLATGSTLDVSDTAQLRLVVSVTNPGSYTNSATAGGDPPSGPGNRVTDDSIGGTDADANGNDDPTDDTRGTPIVFGTPGTVFVVKTADPELASTGSLVFYTVSIQNTGTIPIVDATIEDTLPAGFKFVEGSASLTSMDDVAGTIDPSSVEPLTFDGVDLAIGETALLTYVLRVGSGVVDGDYLNTVRVVDAAGTPLGDDASAAVTIGGDPLLDRTGILGKVFHDRDGDGWQDSSAATEVVVDFGSAGAGSKLNAISIDGVGSDATVTDGALLRLGDLPGCSDEYHCPRPVVVRVPLAGEISGAIEIRTAEGSVLRLAADGAIERLPGRGAARRGTTSQNLVVDRQIESHDGERQLVLSISNRGLDESGIPGVRIVSVVGLRSETDEHGRYHLADIDGGRIERGRNFILKVDPATLPPGAEFTTENPRVLRITRALYNRIDFGVRFDGISLEGRRSRTIDAEVFFERDRAELDDAARNALEPVVRETVTADSGSLTVTGHTERRIPRLRTEERDYTVTPRFGELKAVLREEDRIELDRIVEDWQGAEEIRLEVTGHTSDVPIAARSRHVFPDNYVLSEARARVVAEYLAGRLGVTTDRMAVVGRGPDAPVASNESAEGRAANRRTEVQIRGRFSEREETTGEGFVAASDRELSWRRAESVATALRPAAGVDVEIVGRGHERPRSDNATEDGRTDNRRVDVNGSVSVELPGSGSIWFSEDPLTAEPRLAIDGPAAAAVVDDRITRPVKFRTATNYDAFIERWVLTIHADDDPDGSRPLAVVEGRSALDQSTLVWDGSTGEPLEAGRQIGYTLSVYGARGNHDRTSSKRLVLVEPGEDDTDDPAVSPVANDLVDRGIVIRGSRVRIHAQGLEVGQDVRIDGKSLPTTEDGGAAFERLLEPGSYDFDVEVRSEDGTSWRRSVPLEVRGRYMFLVGMADLTVGQNDLGNNVQPLEADDHYDGDVFVDGRVAFSLKGKIKGRYLIAAQLDTSEDELNDLMDNLDEEDPRSVFRHLDPDRFYPVYGDDSTTIEDVPSQGRFFVRVDWDKSAAQWGNFNTGFTGNEFAQYNRSLYGAQLEHRSVSTTSFGDDRTQLSSFVSPMQTAFAHNEFGATGGSLYYLRHEEVVQGSDKVAIEVRDRDSGRVMENRALRRGRDYEVDELQGRVLLARPLSQIADQLAPSIVKNEPLDGNPVFLLVDYEYRTRDLDEDVAVGARARSWLGDHFALGGTYVSESRDTQDHEMRGVDLTLRHDAGTFVKVEYAESEATQADGWFSDDGGLSFRPGGGAPLATESRDGDAVAVEGRLRLDELVDTERDADVAVWWRDRSSGFSAARTDDGIATTEYGAEAQWEAGQRVDLAARVAVIERDGAADEESAGVQGRIELTERVGLAVEGRRVETQPEAEPDASGTLAAARVDVGVGPGLAVYGSAQATLERDDDYESNDLATVGARLSVGADIALHAETSVGDRGNSLLLGGDYRLDNRNSLYGTYTLSTDRTDAQRGAFVLGHRSRLSNQLNMFVENQFAHRAQEASLGHVLGLDYREDSGWTAGLSVQDSSLDRSGLPDEERNAYSVWFGRQTEELGWEVKLELRKDDGSLRSRQWLTSNRFDYRPSPSLKLFAKLNLSRTEGAPGATDRAQFVEGTLAAAYRPVHQNRWNLLGRYTVLYDLPSEGQRPGQPEQRSHVLSLDALWRLHHRWSVEGKLAYRTSEIRTLRDRGDWFDADARLAVLRSRYHIVSRWDGIAELRRLWSEDADDVRQGFLLGVDRHLGEHLKLGAGYNFTDFTDDLTRFDYDGSGWFVNVTGKY